MILVFAVECWCLWNRSSAEENPERPRLLLHGHHHHTQGHTAQLWRKGQWSTVGGRKPYSLAQIAFQEAWPSSECCEERLLLDLCSPAKGVLWRASAFGWWDPLHPWRDGLLRHQGQGGPLDTYCHEQGGYDHTASRHLPSLHSRRDCTYCPVTS